MSNKCVWALGSGNEEHYHDHEWGVPLHDEQKLFEFLVLEGAQAGLSWRTILDKREAYRAAFDYFDPVKVAGYDHKKLASLLQNPGIVKNRLKIESAVSNAQAFLRVQQEFGGFDHYIWRFVDGETRQNHWLSHSQIPAFSPESVSMCKDLQKRGFKFVGKTICYAYMQAVGMVNDHTVDCFRHSQLIATTTP
ncbi:MULTISPECIES: DNA-3-methyladenine glycosylase I [Methylomonas]|uniref:DNA-3-methyladenine glycosylase I n=2 Tax=Methylomonas TaxID=416 RepID=A0A126T2F9_9GAMM|nr:MULTISPECIES: DNA-3-methyladenine glycosylase I [Methylomonas]AMK76263.1 DNA-3-methyladenine glycosylase [Methylomonas denitrificans]OAI00703.1 DNA-3-methyladenine glycosylase [Methylomonas methanica]TCV88283.1 DNA-3-methyladenine glycosylase I [Methylomonas methanica]